MDARLTNLCHTFVGAFGTIEIWNDPNNAWYEFRILRDGVEVTHSEDEHGTPDSALFRALEITLDY